ncbi:MAG: alpha/beta hydrolase [Eubacteriales bacterium]|nr:alpha/beta hydrolase [Eubacteriales bacterium]
MSRKKRCRSQAVKMWIGIFAGLFIAIMIVNQITVRPFLFVFNALMSFTDEQGNIGPYAKQIEMVREADRFEIPVSGYPNAGVTLYEPENRSDDLPLIVYIHGGGWCSGRASAVRSFAKLLASNGYIVANLDYALAPDYPYPASTFQIAETINYLYKQADAYGIDEKNIFIGGNSAGAHLASQMGGLFTNPNYASEVGVEIEVPAESLKGLLLFNGVYNFDTAGACNFPFYRKLAWAYTGVKDYTQFERIDELSTVKHITESYPAVFITVGDIDPLEPQTLELIEALEANSIDCNDLLWTGQNTKLYHDYIYELNTNEAVTAYEAAASFMKEHTSTTPAVE